ncbi:MAG: hypothetical protein Q4A71_05320 [Actinomycetaceae bacterium]|nr:hypothetical protein [Actinomycetaceae bacterium]
MKKITEAVRFWTSVTDLHDLEKAVGKYRFHEAFRHKNAVARTEAAVRIGVDLARLEGARVPAVQLRAIVAGGTEKAGDADGSGGWENAGNMGNAEGKAKGAITQGKVGAAETWSGACRAAEGVAKGAAAAAAVSPGTVGEPVDAGIALGMGIVNANLYVNQKMGPLNGRTPAPKVPLAQVITGIDREIKRFYRGGGTVGITRDQAALVRVGLLVEEPQGTAWVKAGFIFAELQQAFSTALAGTFTRYYLTNCGAEPTGTWQLYAGMTADLYGFRGALKKYRQGTLAGVTHYLQWWVSELTRGTRASNDMATEILAGRIGK